MCQDQQPGSSCQLSWMSGPAQVRFLFPVLPLFNIGAAVAVARIASGRHWSAATRAAHLGCCSVLAMGFLVTLLITAASRHNYPGGEARPSCSAPGDLPSNRLTVLMEAERRMPAGVALQRMHELAAPEAARALAAGENVSVHIDTLPAMTGATRFFERGRPWVYSKARHTTNTTTFACQQCPGGCGC